MKRDFLLLLSGVLILAACANPKTENSEVSSAKPLEKELPKNFYKRLEGTIAGKKVVMHLQKIDGDYSGSYYYDGAWLNLSTDTLIGKDSLILTENSFYEYYFDQKAKEPHLQLKWNGKAFRGNWLSGDLRKKYPVVLEEKYPDGSYEFSAGQYQDSIKALPGELKSPVASIRFEYLQNKNKDANGEWLNNQLKRISGIKLGSVDRNIGFKKISEAYFSDYQKEVAEQQKNGRDPDYKAWMNFTNNSQQSIDYNDKGYVVVDFLADSYTGGAHGNYSSLLFCLDVQNKKQLVLSDVVKIDSNTLQRILEKNFRKQYNVKPNEGVNTVLFDDFLKPNTNFYFNANGIAFMYNPYEVASYAQGQIVVFIPFNELKGYLNAEFTSRMGI